MGRGRIRKKLQLSKLYSFTGFRDKKTTTTTTSVKDGVELKLGGPGFSRVVYCNDPDCPEARIWNYGDNYVRTTKYTLLTFFPKSLFEQFRRVANFYFLMCGVLALTQIAPYTAVSAIVPLSIIIGASMVKEGVEDWRRKQQDIEVNNRKVQVHINNGVFNYTEWRNLKVGDIVKVEKDNFFPADLLLLSSSYEDAICYVETLNLDGETNLKPKQGLVHTSSFDADSNFKDFKALVKCEDPNANLYSFVGSMEYEMQLCALSPQQLLLRDSKLRSTDYIYGVVIFNGHDTKVMQNSTSLPHKRSKIELKMDRIIYVMFFIVFLMAFFGSILFGIWTKDDIENGVLKRWYLRPDDSTIFFDPNTAPAASFFHLLSVLMLYNYFIPLSLYVSIEIVKVLQSIFISKDIHLYYEETDKPANARTSNLNEELGQVDTILSDKTGTLTCNSMEFVRCSIAGTAYGGDYAEGIESKTTSIRGFNFSDERIMNRNWIKEPQAHVIQKFFQLLAVCHTVLPEVDETTGLVSYEAESPDEAAFVVAAKEIGFEFNGRTQSSILVCEMDMNSIMHEREYQLLDVLEFNSSRKRMSVIVRDEKAKLLLLCKGADSVMFERLANDDRGFVEKTMDHVKEYADAGLRTLILAYKELDEEVYEKFKANFSEAKNSVSADRDLMVDKVAEQIERDLKLLGATAVEDKLQDGVPECIEKLAQAGIKIWVLTGDKMETAINIGFSCRLLRPTMKQIIITLEDPEIQAIEKGGDEKAVRKASKESVRDQIIQGKSLVDKSAETLEKALIIDGKSLAYALEDDTKEIFLQLAMDCASVICCRSSPKQKAMVTRLVKLGIGKTTLAIGDGANDVGMLQEANIGVGISGVEGMQAVMSSDIAIAQFRFLERLLLVHGHWCYRRVSVMICYFFYKNITFGFTLFLYEAYASFSAQPAYNDWFLSLYSLIFTSLPAIGLGIYEQDVPAATCLKFPLLYQEGVKDVLFSWRKILTWMLNGFLSAMIIFYVCVNALEWQAVTSDGHVATRDIFGTTMYTCVVWSVNLQMALNISYFTSRQHVALWGSIIAWYVFLLAYGAIPPTRSKTAYKLLVEALAPTPSFWLVTLLAVISSLVPFFIYTAIRKRFFPMYHETLQAKEKEMVKLHRYISLGHERASQRQNM